MKRLLLLLSAVGVILGTAASIWLWSSPQARNAASSNSFVEPNEFEAAAPDNSHEAHRAEPVAGHKVAIPTVDSRSRRDNEPPRARESLERYVGAETAKAIAAGGPFEPVHVRTLATSIKNYEKYMADLRKHKSEPADLERAMRTYSRLQNQYYAVLSNIDPHQPNPESAKRIQQWHEALRVKGGASTEEERAALKREILIEGQDSKVSVKTAK